MFQVALRPTSYTYNTFISWFLKPGLETPHFHTLRLAWGISSFRFPMFHQEAQSPLLGVLSVPPLPHSGLCHLPASPAQGTHLWCLLTHLFPFWAKLSFSIACFQLVLPPQKCRKGTGVWQSFCFFCLEFALP